MRIFVIDLYEGKEVKSFRIKELQVNIHKDMNPFYGSIACFPILLTLFMCGFAEIYKKEKHLFV